MKIQKRHDSILKEAKLVTKWNKKQYNRKFRRTNKFISLKGNNYRKTNSDAIWNTLA